MADDASLVLRTVAGDRSAFGQLYDRYARVVRAICFDTTREAHAAQELAQDVFLRAFANLPKLRNVDRFGPWLVSMSRNVCRDWRRARRRDRHRYVENAPEPIERLPDDASDSIHELRLAITKLPEQERLALHLFYLQGDSAEVAREFLGLSHAGFYKVVARARARLAELMSSEQETFR